MAVSSEFCKTCFIVGAGASTDFGFPTGEGLIDRISALLKVRDGERSSGLNGAAAQTIRDCADSISKTAGTPKTDLVQFRLVSNSMPLAPSIDNFLEAHQNQANIVNIGKLAIAHEIMVAESKSPIFFRRATFGQTINFSSIRWSWLSVLFRQLSAGVKWEQFCTRLNRVSFVCFNYDRVIERFLFLASCQYFGCGADEVKEQLTSNLNIVHPYGQVGNDVFKLEHSDFGAVDDHRVLIDASSGIKTFTEGLRDTATAQKMQASLREADVLCFLGFGFHKINLDHLGVGGASHFRHVIATSMGMSENFVNIVKDELNGDIAKCHEDDVHFRNCNCSELLLDFGGLLSGRGRPSTIG